MRKVECRLVFISVVSQLAFIIINFMLGFKSLGRLSGKGVGERGFGAVNQQVALVSFEKMMFYSALSPIGIKGNYACMHYNAND